MDVLKYVFTSVSQYNYDDFYPEADSKLAKSYLKLASNRFAENSLHRRVLSEALLIIESKENCLFLREPEIYNPILNLAVSELSEEKINKYFYIICRQLSMKHEFHLPKDLIYIRKICANYICEEKNKIILESSNVFFNIKNISAVFVKPLNNLYSDILPTELYPELFNRKMKNVKSTMEESYDIIKFSQIPAYFDIIHFISAVCLTPPIHRPSFSNRLGYFGGIFINAFDRNPVEISEGIIHEYLHQRLWEWWAFEKIIEDIDEERVIISPVTGQKRPFNTLIQAAVIYAQLIIFYRGIFHYGNNFSRLIENRYNYLKEKNTLLIDHLSLIAHKKNKARGILEAVKEISTTFI